MAVALLELEVLNVGEVLSQLKALAGQASTYAKMGGPTVPGIPDIKELIKSTIEAVVDQIPIIAREQILILLAGAMSGVLINNIPKINKIIRALNRIIKLIKKAINALIPIAKTIFKIIIALVIAYTVTKIVGLIPSPGVGLGAVVVFDMAKTICAELINIIGSLLESLWPLAFAIIAIIMLLLSIFSFSHATLGITQDFFQQQINASAGANDAFSKSADDWANSTDIGGVAGMGSLSMVECTLPSGEIRQMTAEDCIAAGGTVTGDGTGGGGFCVAGEECANLNYEECLNSPDCYWDNIISSLLNLDDSVTVEKATKHKGKRYGFYGSESGTTKSKEELTLDRETPLDEADLNELVDELDKISEEIDKDSSNKRKTIEETLINVKKREE